MTLQRRAKLATYSAARASGLFSMVMKSNWRKQRLLVLCYHGLSVDREHEWRPTLFLQPEVFRQRMAALKRSGIKVVSLADGLRALASGALDQPTAVITFDDGFQDFQVHAAQVLADYQFPATVYQTTWYVDRPYPVVGVFCNYLLWMRMGTDLKLGSEFGFSVAPPLRTEREVEDAAESIIRFADRSGMSGDEKDDLARRLCIATGFDYEKVLRTRLLGLLNSDEIRALSAAGIDFELHTHRHRTPLVEGPFKTEIVDNRAALERITGKTPRYFCYPSGEFYPALLPWLRDEGVENAVTCVRALGSRESDPLLFPRMSDGAHVTQVEFDAWLSGFEPRLRGLR